MDIKNIEDFIVAREHDFLIIERVKNQTELEQIKELIIKHKGIFVSQENMLKDLNFKEMLVMLDAKCGAVYAHNLYTDCMDVRVVNILKGKE